MSIILNHRISRNAAALLIVQVVNYVAPLVLLLYLTDTLGLQLYGVVAYSMGIGVLAGVLIDFGFSISATAKISKHRHRPWYVGRLLGSIYIIKLLLIVSVFLILAIYAATTEKYSAYRWLFIISILPISALGLLPVFFFQGVEKMKAIAAYSVLAKVLFVIAVLSLVHSPADYLWIPVANGISQAIALAIALYLTYKLGYVIRLPRKRDLKYALKLTLPFFYSRISVATYLSSAPVILGTVSTPASVAIYTMAEQFYKVMQGIFGPINQATYPYMARERNLPLLLKLTLGCVGLAILGAVTGYFVFPYLLDLLFKEEWLNSLPVMNVFFIAIVVNVAAVFAGYPLGAAVNNLQPANTSVTGGSLLYLALLAILLLFGRLNPVNLAILMVISELYVLIHRATVLVPIAIKQHALKRRNQPA